MRSLNLLDTAFIIRSLDTPTLLPASELLYGSNITVFQFSSLALTPSVVKGPEIILTYSLDSGSIPASATLNPSTGVVSGFITASPGFYSSVIRASWDAPGEGGSIVSALTITVLGLSFDSF